MIEILKYLILIYHKIINIKAELRYKLELFTDKELIFLYCSILLIGIGISISIVMIGTSIFVEQLYERCPDLTLAESNWLQASNQYPLPTEIECNDSLFETKKIIKTIELLGIFFVGLGAVMQTGVAIHIHKSTFRS